MKHSIIYYDQPSCFNSWAIMECLKKITIACILMILMVLSSRVECRDPVLHRVGGGRFTWQPTVNFTKWAIQEHFYVGDWLYFGFDKHLYNVLEVNKTSYQKCIDKGFITNITRGGRDVFNLTNARPYYFICGGDYCFKGLKLAITVEEFSHHTESLIVSHGCSLHIEGQLFPLAILASYVLLKVLV